MARGLPMNKKERIAIVDGVRTPFCKAGGLLKDMEADELGSFAVKELLARLDWPVQEISEVIFGNVLQPPHATNIARVIAVKGGVPIGVPALTVNRNCASGMAAVVTAAYKLHSGEADVIIAGGVESMSHFPVLFNRKMRDFLRSMNKARGWRQKASLLLSFRPSLLVPEIPKIADPLCGLSMGQTAEILVREFAIARTEQDEFSFASHDKASLAQKLGLLAQEIIAVPLPPKYAAMQLTDDGPRTDQTLQALAALRPAFDKDAGTVTAGNSSQITDGAAALLLMRESTAKERGITPLGYLSHSAVAALEPSRMGLGPYFAMAKVLKNTGMHLADFDLFEINEAFAAQVLAVIKACASPSFAQRELGHSSALGEIDINKLNVNGGAIALGHPIGASGARIILAILKELKRRNKQLGLASLCVGGGQGEAVILESV